MLGYSSSSSKRTRSHKTRQTLQVVDDTDTSLAYVGTWRALQWSAAFNSTMHSTNAAGAAIEYHFNGPSIFVYGPVGIAAKYGIPVSTYTIDDSPPVTFTAPQNDGSDPLNNVPFFSATNLSPDSHTLIIRRASTDDATYFFDFIQIQQSFDSSGPLPTVSFGNAHGIPTPTTPSTSSSSSATTTAIDEDTTSDVPTSAPSTNIAMASSADITIPSSADITSTASVEMTWSSSSSSGIVAPNSSFTISFPTAILPTDNIASALPTDSPAPSTPMPTTAPSFSSDSPSHKNSNVKDIIAGVVAGTALVIIMVVAYIIRRRRRIRTRSISAFDSDVPGRTMGEISPPHSSTAMLKWPATGYHAVPLYSARSAGSDTASIYSIQPDSTPEHDAQENVTHWTQDARDVPERAARPRGFSYDQLEPVNLAGYPSLAVLPTRTMQSDPIRDTDGGIRLAGGPIGEASDEPDLLPPAYSPNFGRSRLYSMDPL